MSDPTLSPDVNIGPSALIAGWTEASIATIIVAMRIYTQAKIVGQFGIDDYLMILALISAVLNTSLITEAVRWGIGRHIWYLTDIERINAVKYEFIAQTPGIVAPTLARMSFAIYLLKFVGTSRLRRWTLWFVVITQAGVNFVQLILIYIQCPHFYYLWDNPNGPGVGCWSSEVQVDSGYVLGAVNCIHDLILTILPIVILKGLKMNLRIKIILSVLMGMSVFAFAASVVKTITIGNLGKHNDFTWNTVEFIHWFTIENYVVIIASSVPALRPLLTYVKKQVNTQGGSYAMNSYGKQNSRGTKGYMPYGEGADGTLKSYNNSTFVGNGSVMDSTTTKKLPDSESEEYILPIQNSGGAGITKTTNVSVMYTANDKRDVERGA